MIAHDQTQRSVTPALLGLVALVVLNMVVFVGGYRLQGDRMERMMEVSGLHESTNALERELIDTSRYLSLASDDLLGPQREAILAEFEIQFDHRAINLGELADQVRMASMSAGFDSGINVAREVDRLIASWNTFVGSLETDLAEATIELMMVSDPIASHLLGQQVPGLLETTEAISRQSQEQYRQITRFTQIILLLVSLFSLIAVVALVSHILGIQRERDQMETSLRKASEDAKQASVAKSRFLSNMSHELRTPMNGVIGMANILTSQVMPAHQQQMVSVLKSSADTALTLINDILDFEAIEAGKVYLESRSFTLSSLMDRVHHVALAQLTDKEVDLHMFIDANVPTEAFGDEDRLAQVINNLVSNAIKFTSEGSVTVTAARSTRTEITFSVQDTGTGIEPDRIEALFEAFKQADDSIRRRFGGTGLGLSISRNLVHMMGGSISVESTPGRGSTFAVTVPIILDEVHVEDASDEGYRLPEQSSISIAESKPQNAFFGAHSAGLGVSEDGPVPTILCVDDNTINLEVARYLLEDAGFKCITAQSGQEALESIAREAITMVLMDYHMYGMNGLETTKAMHRDYPELPIFALTADATPDAIDSCKEAGMHGMITKPIVPEELMSLISRVHGIKVPQPQ